jgi:putative DNA primase/helicase
VGWAKENLSAEGRRAIAEGLIRQGGGKVTQRDRGRGELIGLCPLHQESNPSFGYNYAKDVYNCSSGCGGGDLIKLFAGVNGISNKAGFKRFKAQHGAEDGQGRDCGSKAKPGHEQGRNAEPKKPPPAIPEEAYQVLEPLPETWVKKLMKDRAWTPEAIERLGLRLWQAPQRGVRKAAQDQKLYCGRAGEKRIAIPVRNQKGSLVNIRLYLPGAEGKKVVSWGKGYGSTRLWPREA